MMVDLNAYTNTQQSNVHISYSRYLPRNLPRKFMWDRFRSSDNVVDRRSIFERRSRRGSVTVTANLRSGCGDRSGQWQSYEKLHVFFSFSFCLWSDWVVRTDQLFQPEHFTLEVIESICSSICRSIILIPSRRSNGTLTRIVILLINFAQSIT